MRVHQIITGSCNGDYSHISQAKVRGSNYIVYASGCDIVILNESFCRSQVISGGELGSSVVTAVSFNHWDGKIAVANAKGIYVYVPQATTDGLLTNSSKLLWSFSSYIPLPKSEVVCLCWSHRPCFEFPNFGLLAGFEDGQLCMWRSDTVSNVVHSTPRFHIGTDLIDLQDETGSSGLINSTPDTQSEWRVVWRHQMKGTPLQIDFSTDGLYFASIIKCNEPNNNHGIKFNNIMHVWFHDPCYKMNPLKSHNHEGKFQMTENWEPIHLPHPCDVYSFNWRRTSRYLPSGWIPNVLLTAGEDNLCRVWVEVTHPQPGYSSLSNTPHKAGNSSLFGSTQMGNESDIPISSKVKLRIPQGGSIDTEVKYKATYESTKEMNESHGLPSSLSSCENYITVELPDCFLKHPLLKHFLDLWLTDPLSKIQVDYQGTTANNDAVGKLNFPVNLSFPQFTFTTSLPLDNFPEISSLHSTTTTTTNSSNRSYIGRFTTHWFNNKEYRFNTQLEIFMMDAISRILAIPVHISADNTSSSSSTSLPSLSANNNTVSPELSDQIALMDQTVFKLLGELQHAPDVVFAIHPIDGSLIVWYIHGLDMSVPNSKGIRTQKVSIPRETAGRDDAKFNCESAFTLIPNMGGRLTQVTCSVRSRLHQAIPLDAAYSISHRLFTYLTTDHLKSKMNQSLYTTTNKNNFSSIHATKDRRNPLMTINYQDNLDIFCHLFLLKYAVNQVFAQFSKFALKYTTPATTTNSSATKILDQLKQKQLKPILSSLAEIQLNSTMFESRVQHSSHVAMITMHTNGSLRYWRIDVSEHSHYQWIVSISGCSRLSGHRFHTSTIVPHPLLPLALSTSQYAHKVEEKLMQHHHPSSTSKACQSINFNEIILWHISSVGPLTTGYTSSLLSTNCQSNCLQHSQLNRPLHTGGGMNSSLTTNNMDISGCGNISSHGGISEIARLNFSNISNNSCLTFKHIAWFPCMVTTSATSYPVALFVASLDTTNTTNMSRNISSVNAVGDDQLGLFLTFSKFKQINNHNNNNHSNSNSNSRPMNETNSDEHRRLLYSSRNSDTLGCIIQLDYDIPYSSSRMKDDDQSYTAETLLLHVFPSQLIMMNMDNCKPRTNPLSVVLHTTDNPLESSETDSDCLESNSSLSTFLIVRMTRYTMNGNDDNNKTNSTILTTETKETEFCRMEMWRVLVSTNTRSCSQTTPTIGSLLKVVDIDNLTTYNNLITNATKVCDCKLNLPSSVSIICAQVSAAHVSWAALSTFNAPPPYLIVSACSDGCLRFWKCESNTPDYSISDKAKSKFINLFTWDEWQMPLMQSMSSCIELQLQGDSTTTTTTNNNNNTSPEMTTTPNIIILDMDCAYSGRLAVAYTTQELYDGGRSITTTATNTTTNNNNTGTRTIYVTVYECESSGGCEWILEDTIEFTSAFPFQENNNNNNNSNNLDKLSIQLDWVNAEDGGHLLSVIIDNEIFVFAPVCQNINFTHTTTTTNNNNKNNKLKGRHLYQPTLMTTLGEVYIGWKPIACSRIMTADYPGTLQSSSNITESNDAEEQLASYSLYDVTKKQPIRQYHRHSGGHKQAAWLRDGLLLVGARTEMQLFSQWPSDSLFSVFKWQVKVKSDNPHAARAVTSSQPSSRTGSFDANTSTDNTDATVSGSASMSVARLAKVYSAYPLKSSPSKSLLHAGSQSNLTNLTGVNSSSTTTTTTTTTKKMSTTVEPNEYHRQLSREMSQIDLSCATTGGIDVKSNEQILKDIELLSNLGLFEAIQVVNPVLPQFHPRQLLEWMNLGHLRRIKAILAHLTRCLSAFGSPSSSSSGKQLQHHGTPTSSRRMTKGNLNSELTNLGMGSFDTSISAGRTSGKPGTLQSKVATSASSSSSTSSNLLEAQAIPPLPLYILLAVDSLQVTDVSADVETSKQFDPLNDWNDEFGSVDESKIFEIQDDDLNFNEEEVADGASLKSHTESKQSLSNSSTQKASQFYGFSIWSLKPAALARSIQFSEDDARILAEHLSTQQLPGLSPLDQMYLLGIADLMAKTHSDITDCLSVGNYTRRDSKQHHTSSSLPKQASIKDSSTKQGLDECGLRFLLTVQLYSYLSKTLPPARRAQLLSSGLTNSSLVWAYHSDSQEELLSRLPIAAATTTTTTNTTTGGFSSIDALELNWPDFKRYGCGWWIRSESLLIRCAEKMARTAFQTTKDPMDAAVFYLAMRKAKMVAALFKTTGNKTLENFFRSDFTPGQPACRQAKLNAFRLLSQHKYLQAAGLFLLAGCLEDAVRVCLDTLKDLQLGVLIVRLYTSSSPGISGHTTVSAYHDFLRQHLIKHEDPFLRSMAFWSLGDPLAALQTLLEGPGILVNTDNSGIPVKRDSIVQSVQQSPQHPRHLSGNTNLTPGTGSSSSSSTTTTPTKSVCPSVFKFYTYLQSHPLVLRQQRIEAASLIDSGTVYRVKSLERRLYFRTAHHYFVLGCPTLALEVLTKLPPLELVTFSSNMDPMRRMSTGGGAVTTPSSTTSRRQSEILSGHVVAQSEISTKKESVEEDDDNLFTLSYDDPIQKYESAKSQDQFTLQWSDDDEDKEDDKDNGHKDKIEGAVDKSTRNNSISQQQQQQQTTSQSLDDFTIEGRGVVDLIANQLKFIACLKILAEELSTLAAGAESEGVSLRQHVWQWLENELAVVNSLTGLSKSSTSTPTGERITEHNTSVISSDNSEYSGPLTSTSYLLTTRNTGSVLAGIFMSLSNVSSEIREAELKRLKTRYDWIKTHETFLTSLINFCDLYGSSGMRLPAVRIELSLLLNELYSSASSPSSCLPANQSTGQYSAYKSDSNLVAHNGAGIGGGYSPSPLNSCWPMSAVALIDGIPLLRTVMRLPPGVLLLPDSVKRIKYMVHDLITCLELLPPPFLVSVLLPYPYRSPHAHHHHKSTTGKKLKSHTSGKASTTSASQLSTYYCPDCIWTPTADRQRRVYLLRNLCAALSACIHQCLSVGGWLGLGYLLDENSMMNNSSLTKVFALPATSSINARSVDRLCVSGQVFRPNTEPAKWPGLTCLKSYTDPQIQTSAIHPSHMMRIASSAQNLSERGESAMLSTPPVVIQSVDRRRLIGLLAQALAASYFGLLVYALYTRDTSILYRLACARLDSKTWSRVFGGTYRAKPYRPPTQPPGSNISSSSVTFNLKTPTTTATDKKGVAPPPPKPPSRPKRPNPISGRHDRSKSRSPEKAVTKARDRAVAALEVASKIGSPPKSSVLTSQHIRFLAHAEAAAIADSKSETYRPDTSDNRSASGEQQATTGDQQQQQQQQQQASVSPDEWFIFAQSSILSCLLERPPKQTDLPADVDPNHVMYDSDVSEPSVNTTSGGGEYYTYQEALTKHQHCINRVRRFIKQSQRIKQRKSLQHRVKHSLHYRLTGKFTNRSHDDEDADGAEEDEEKDGECHDLTDKDDSDLDEDAGVVGKDKGVIPIDKLYLPPISSLSSAPEAKTTQSSVSHDSNLNQLLQKLSSDLQPQWILRRLHLNPDFTDTWWGSELECEFYAALNELTTESTEKGQTRATTATTATSLKDFYDYMSRSGDTGGDNNPPPSGNDDFNEEDGGGAGGADDDEDDDEEDDNLIVDPLGYRKLTIFERERQWAHSDSYAWRLIRLGLMQLAKRELNRLIQIVDFNSEDLAVYAPGLMTLTRQVDCWITGYRLELTSPPAINPVQLKLGLKGFIDEHLIPSAEFLPNIDEDITASGLQSSIATTTTTTTISGISNISSAKNTNEIPNELSHSQAAARSMLRMKKLLNTKKTPFQTHDPFSLPVKCLWCYLVRQPEVDDMFLRHIFRKPCVVQSTITSQIKFSLPTGSSNILSGMAKSTSSLNLKGITSSNSNIGMTGSNTPTPSHTTATSTTLSGGVLLTDMSKSSGKQTRTQQQQQQQQSQASSGNQTNSTALLLDDAVRLIHKEHDPLIAMCINQVNFNAIAIATPKEIIELDIENLVNLPPWYADEVEYDLESMRRPQTRRYPEGGTDDFIVCDTAGGSGGGSGTSTKYGGVDHHSSEMTTASNITSSSTSGLSSVGDSSSSGSGSHVFRSMHLHPLHANLANLSKQALERSRRLATTILKRTLPAVYSLASHPTMPYYLSGTGTGSVHMFEWSTPVPVVAGFTNTFSLTAAGASGQFPAGSRGARVTALQFDDSGYRFGCGDAEGNFGLWNLYSTMPGKLPYFRCRCHAKGLADFCFLGCSSLIATVGNGGISTASFTSSGLVESTGSSGGGGGTGGIAQFTSSSSGSGSSSYSSGGGGGNISLDQDASHLTLWDTLLPVNRCGVIRVLDPELDAPCTSIAYCGAFSQVNRWPHSTSSSGLYNNTAETSTSSSSTKRLYTSDRTVIVGNKNGDVCIVDLRRPKVLHKFSAHESAVRTLCIDTMTDCLMTGGADGIVKIWRLSEQELITSFCGDLNPTRGAAVVAAAALFRGNQSAAIIAATNPGISDIRLLPTVTGASLLQRHHSSNNTITATTASSSSNNNPFIKEYDPSIVDLTDSTGGHQNQKHSITAASIACRFLSCGADGGLRMRSLVVRPKPYMVY